MSQKEQSIRNIGPKCIKHLHEVGLYTLEHIRELGVEETFTKIFFRFAGEFSFTSVYLYALEGAILDCDWRQIPATRKEELKIFFQKLKQKYKHTIN